MTSSCLWYISSYMPEVLPEAITKNVLPPSRFLGCFSSLKRSSSFFGIKVSSSRTLPVSRIHEYNGVLMILVVNE